MSEKTALIVGVSGQDGAYLSELLLSKGYKVVGITREINDKELSRLAYFKILDKVTIEECDVLHKDKLEKIINNHKPHEIYNLAAQSSVGISFQKPELTFKINTLSVLHLLEIIKNKDTKIKLFHASSGEIFGDTKELPVNENSIINPLSPYAVSKAAAHMLVNNYRTSYNLFACNGILFNHESPLRGEEFFIGKIIKESMRIAKGEQDVLKVGNIDIKRDFGYAPDYVEAMWLMLQQEQPDDYIVSSGKSVSLREVIYYVFEKLNIDKERLVIDPELYRPADIEESFGNNTKIRESLGWNYDKDFYQVLDILIKAN